MRLPRLHLLQRLRAPGVIDHEYRFSATQNNGRIAQRKDWISGEEITYQYDSLQRLISAETTGPEWGQSFTFDGFGNLLQQTVTKGSAPSLSVLVDTATNHITTSGYAYDANGNLTAMPTLSSLVYDLDNRLITATHSSNGTDQYRYDPSNRRVWKKKPDETQETYFYGIDGRKLGTYSGGTAGTPFATVHTNVYFAGKLIWAEGAAAVTDRLGSVVSGNRKYFPYGEEPTTTAQDKTKFATYYRDNTTALDYANQRYYGRTVGRFLTLDPHWDSARRTIPQSWNRYTYVLGDPTNYADPTGLTVQPWLDPGIVDGYNGTIDFSDYAASGGNLEEWADAWWDSHIPDPENGSPPTLPNPGQQITPQPAPEPRVPMYLKIIWDCYRPNGAQFTVGYTRVIRYQVVDQNGLAFAGSSVPTVKEEVVTTSGPTIVGGGVWSRENNSITPNGQCVDFYSANGNDPSTANQSFTATTSDGATYSLMVRFPGDPRVLNNYYSKTEVKVHNTRTSTVCGDAHQGSW